MSEHLESETDRLDKQVAEFTDRLLGQSLPGVDTPEQDQELRGYQEILIRLSQTAKDTPDQELTERVRSHLLKQWNVTEQLSTSSIQPRLPTKSKTPSVYQSNRQRQKFSLRLAFAAIVIVVFSAFFLIPTINHAIPGAAGGQADIVSFLVIIILCGSLAVWWFFYRKG